MLRGAILSAVLAVSLVGYASGAQKSQQPPSQASQQQPIKEERGSEKSPVIVKVLPPEKSKDELDAEIAKQESDRQLVKLTGDLAAYTRLLFVATGLLAVITAGLVIAGFLQVRDAKASIAAAVKSAGAAEKAAAAAESQTAIIGDQNDTLKKQHAVGRLQFLAVHRPKLRVRLFRLRHLEVGKPVVVDYEVVNVGDTDACDVERQMAISVFMGAETPPIDGVSLPFDRPISPGETRLVSWKTAIIHDRDWRVFSIELTGRIAYRDGNGVPRRTAFDRRYTSDTDRFSPVDDPNHEYEYED
jgi:hypothetical protein